MSLKAIREYGVSATIKFSIFEFDGINFRVDAVHAAGDTVISKDEGVEINTFNGFVDEGTGYSIVLTAAEMTATRIEIFIVDQTDPKAWLDKSLIIETYGNASAQHAFNLNTAVQGVSMDEILGTALVESSAGRLAGNFEFFYDNSDQQTTKIVDDVGTSFLTGPKDFFAVSQTETDVTVISGGFADTAAVGGDEFIFAHSGTGLDLRLNFNVGSNIKMTSFEVLAGLDTNGNRKATIELFDFVGVGFDVFDTMTNTSSELDFFPHSNVDPKYTDTNGDVIISFKSFDLQSGNRINVDLAKVTAVVAAGTIPSATENAVENWRLGDTLHGKGPYRGNALAFTEVDIVTSQTEFVLNSGPSQDITQSGVIALFTDKDNKNTIGVGKVVSWTAATLTLIIENALGFTVVAGDGVDMFLASTTVDLTDNDVNKKIIAQSIKEFDASTLSIDPGSLLKEVFDQVFDVNIVQVDGAPNADGNSFNFVFQAVAAMACGNFSLDTPVDGQTTFFKTDKLTPLFIVETTDIIRNRIS